MKIEKFPNVKISQKEVFRDARGSFQRICSSGDFNVEMARYNAVRVQGSNKGAECTPQQ